jgi:hypothetical protein
MIIHTYHSRITSSETPTFNRTYLAMRNTVDVTSRKPITVQSQSIQCVLILESPFTTSIAERERCYSYVLSRTPHETSSSSSAYLCSWRNVPSKARRSWRNKIFGHPSDELSTLLNFCDRTPSTLTAGPSSSSS